MKDDPHSLYKKGQIVSNDILFQDFDTLLTLKGAKTAIEYCDIDNNKTSSYSYTELNSITKNIAGYLESVVGNNGSVAFSYNNCPEVVFINYAAWRSGLITVPLDVRRDTLERKIYKLKLSKTQILFTHDNDPTNRENKAINNAIPSLKIVTTKSCDHLIKHASSSNKKFTDKKVSLNKTCMILFTSGTTSLPKGVELSLASLFANAESINEWLEINEKDKFLIVLPLHHINSTTFVNSTILAKGTVILSSKYSKSRYWETMAKHNATISSIVPTIAHDLVDESISFVKNKSNLEQVSRIQIGSAPVQPHVAKTFVKQFNIPLFQGYGQTETSLRSTGVPISLNEKEYTNILDSNSLGIELKLTNTTILDKNGNEMGEGAVGEICIRGPVIMNGYLNDKKATKESFNRGWFHSGDTGYWKERFGYKFFFLKGRKKEIIKKAGTLISPLAIENTILKNYKDIDKIYAVGFPDDRLGQEIGIVVVAKDENVLETIMNDAKKGRIDNLTKYESPAAAILVKEPELPVTSTGKIQRIKIRELFSDKLLRESQIIQRTKNHTFKVISPNEDSIIKEAQKINNQMWGDNLESSFREFKLRAKYAILVGVFDIEDNLMGSISALIANEKELSRIGNNNYWMNTWDGLTNKGTFSTHNRKGDALICPTISVKRINPLKSKANRFTRNINEQSLNEYLSSKKDYVIRFHDKPKGGQKKGGRIIRIIPNGRPKDLDSLGYNLLIKYPMITELPTINEKSSLGVQLIEAAMILAYNSEISNIYAYSRPGELSKHFTNN